ncbi:Mu-like prophage major head subunit gpT family protein [Sulfuriflexus mobilis]|uniref:Mu-like prophage major head subunit gpT family protein n=1 Tax=Sulfuriflexus mobilis TaxID=1811807 RepID=UPI000F836CC3|nr:Mu-like prophage major head subunit gpT family protein [Sulfuriflexus mobilis]
MLINKANLERIFANLKTSFHNAFEAAPSTWEKIAMKVPSTGAQNDYSWLSNFPKMQRWIDEKAIKALKAFKYVITNDDFETTVEVDRNHIEDDNIGIYGPQAQGAGFASKQFPDELVYEAVNAAFATPCYDGQFFFDTDHEVKGASVSNKGTKVLAISTLALAQGSYGAGRTAMRKFKDDEGRPLGVRPNILLVPPALEDTANALMSVDKLEDGKPNPYKGTAEVVVGDWLTSDTAWFLLDTTKPVKPFIYQERKAPVFVSQTDMNADGVFLRKKYLFGAEARGASGYGFWQLAWGSDGTV